MLTLSLLLTNMYHQLLYVTLLVPMKSTVTLEYYANTACIQAQVMT